MKNKLIMIAAFFSLVSCGSDPIDTNTRDLTEAITFSELVEMRRVNNTSLDGQTVLINDELTITDYGYNIVACADYALCTQENFNFEVTDPVYQSHNSYNIGCFHTDGFKLSAETASEDLLLDESQIEQFLVLTEEQTVHANFYAEVEFVERSPYCSAQVNYGINIIRSNLHLLIN